MESKKNCLILMTALVPTTGHRDLVRFAQGLPDTHVHVMLNARSFEPGSMGMRVKALDASLSMENVTIHGVMDDDALQEPRGPRDDAFWAWWRKSIAHHLGIDSWDYVVACASYGQRMAQELGAIFLPYDLARVHNDAQGTTVRRDPLGNWGKILPGYRGEHVQRGVMFGQESVGKTTVGSLVAKNLHGHFMEEWARPYLEMPEVGGEVTVEKMHAIDLGQGAFERAFRTSAPAPFEILDTDLYSTIGYWRIFGHEVPTEALQWAEELSRGKIYFLMPDVDVPFVPDPIRYGGDHRESTREFWRDILDEFSLPYIEVSPGSVEEKAEFISEVLRRSFEEAWAPISSFVREQELLAQDIPVVNG